MSLLDSQRVRDRNFLETIRDLIVRVARLERFSLSNALQWRQDEATWSPGSIANGAAATTTIVVAGATTGDYTIARYDGLTVTGWILDANVVDDSGTVAVTLLNLTGGALSPSGTLSVIVLVTDLVNQ